MNYVQIYFRKKRMALEVITSIPVLFISLFVTSCIIVTLFVYVFLKPPVVEPMINLQPYPESMTNGPLANQQKIICGCKITNFLVFNIEKNNFTFQGDLWFTYDPSQVQPSVFSRFDIVGGKITDLVGPFITQHDATHATLLYRITADFIADLTYADFPFDAHRLSINFEFPDIDNEKTFLKTIPESLKFASDIRIQGWNFEKVTQSVGGMLPVIRNSVADKLDHAHAVFSAIFIRSSYKKIFLVFIPLFLIFFIGLFSLTFDVVKNVSTVLSLTVGGVTALFFYQSSVASISPVAEYFTLADRVYMVLLVLTIVTLTVQIYLLHYYHNKEAITSLPEVLERTAMTLNIVRSGFFLFFLVAMICAIGLLLV